MGKLAEDRDTVEVLMPLMGEGITEASLVQWLKKVGDTVAKGEPLVEISTDKVDTEMPSPAAGVLTATFAEAGAVVQVNAVIAHLSAAGAAAKPGAAAPAQPAAAAAPAAAAPASAAAATPPTEASRTSQKSEARDAQKLRSSPLVRKLAADRNIDLREVTGTGLGGRITKRDLETARAAPAPAPAKPQTAAHLEYGRLETRQAQGVELLDGVPVRREKMSRMRALIAEHMVRSVRTSPHVTTVFEIDLHRIDRLREAHKAAFRERNGVNLTYTAFFATCAVAAIKRHPIVNVSVDGDDILWKDQINLGVAVALDSGLIVPVVKDAGELNLAGMARRIADLAARARSKRLTPEDVQGGTFSITNPGMFGSIVSAPIINQPQVAIMAVGAVVKRPVVVEDMIAIRPIVQIGLTFDHRVVDGEGGARFLATLKDLLENFEGPVV